MKIDKFSQLKQLNSASNSEANFPSMTEMQGVESLNSYVVPNNYDDHSSIISIGSHPNNENPKILLSNVEVKEYLEDTQRKAYQVQ